MIEINNPQLSLSTRLCALWTSLWPKTLPSSLPISLFSSAPCWSVQNTSMRRHNRLRRHWQFALGRLWHWASWLNRRINLLQHAPPSLGFACSLSFLYWGVWFAGKFLTKKRSFPLSAVWTFERCLGIWCTDDREICAAHAEKQTPVGFSAAPMHRWDKSTKKAERVCLFDYL